MPVTVAALRSSPVKGLAQAAVDELWLDERGLRDDRRFAIVDPSGLARYTAQLRELAGATASWDPDRDVLELRFADAERVRAPVVEGERVDAHGYARRPMPGRLVEGPFAEALGARLGLAELDPRRFKMSIELDGLGAHEEDGWEGRELRIGGARLRVGGRVGRCALTTMDPDCLRLDHDVLRTLLDYRGALPTGEPPFGMYAEEAAPGRVAVGDPVEMVAAADR